MKKIILVLLFVLCSLPYANTQPAESGSIRMQRFKDAKLGIFIHWGIYAVNGIDESWSFYNEYLPYEEYIEKSDNWTVRQEKSQTGKSSHLPTSKSPNHQITQSSNHPILPSYSPIKPFHL